MDFTWGAGGSTADLTLELTIEARRRFGLLANMHLTCTNMPTEKVRIGLDLTGDIGKGGPRWWLSRRDQGRALHA